MFYSNALSQVFPDQNVFSHPFYKHNYFFRPSQNGPSASEEESKFQGHSGNLGNFGPSQNNLSYSAFPRQVKLVVLQNEKEDNLLISNTIGFFIKADRSNENSNLNSETHFSDSHSDSESSPSKFLVTKNTYSNEFITEFNNHPKLKKVNSTYHIKRKISTKLQKDLKESINALIIQINHQLNQKISLLTHNSKEFRENVKIDFLKHYGNQTVAKYVCEDVLLERKTPTSSGLESNKKLIKRIEDLYQFYPEIQLLKKLISLFHETLVKDFYTEFLGSSRYKKCVEKDLLKYTQKLCKVDDTFSNLKKKFFTEIYAVKYDEIAKNYFT